MLKILLALMITLLLSGPTVCMRFFNFLSECTKWAKVIEDLLNDISSSISIIEIHNEMEKHEKFGFIRLFTGFLKMVGYDPRILVAISAANTGIDN